jgi:hypothetical protein
MIVTPQVMRLGLGSRVQGLGEKNDNKKSVALVSYQLNFAQNAKIFI